MTFLPGNVPTKHFVSISHYYLGQSGILYETAHFVGRMVPRLEIPSSRGQKYGYQKESFGEIQENRCDESS
jgi:hypothetical protein